MQTPEEYEVSQRIGLLIKGLKHKRGMSREDICRHLGIGMRTLDNYLNGVSSFKLGTLMKFADLCRVKLADILDDTEALSRLYPDNMKDKGSILTLILGSIAGYFLIFESIVFLLLLFLFFCCYKDKNSQTITGIFLFIYALEVAVAYLLKFIIFPAVESYYIENIYAFGLQLTLSLMLLFLLKHRMTISVFLTQGKSAPVFEKNGIEAPIYLLAMTLALIDFLALMENFIRNLERLGVNEETAKVFWEVRFFYDYFEYLKAIPIFLCIALLYVGFIARRNAPLHVRVTL